MPNELAIIERDGFHMIPQGVDAETAVAAIPRASEAKCKKAAIMLFSGLKERSGDELDAVTKLRVYERTLARFPAYAVDAAIEAFLIGEVEGASKTFVPATAELAAECKRQMWAKVRREKPCEAGQSQEEHIKDFADRWKAEMQFVMDGKEI